MATENPRRVLDLGTGQGGVYFFHNPESEYRLCADISKNLLASMFTQIADLRASLLPGQSTAEVDHILNKSIEAVRADVIHLKTVFHIFPEVFDQVDVMFPYGTLLIDLLSDRSRVWPEIARVTKKHGEFRILNEVYLDHCTISLDENNPDNFIRIDRPIEKLATNALKAGFDVRAIPLPREVVLEIGTPIGNEFVHNKSAKEKYDIDINFNLLVGRKRSL